MASLKGIWNLNEDASLEEGSNVPNYNDINFTSNGLSFYQIQIYDGTLVDVHVELMYRNADGEARMISMFSNSLGFNSDYQTWDFGETEQVVDDDFYAWFTANATPQDGSVEERSISEINLYGVKYNIEDATARKLIEILMKKVEALEGLVGTNDNLLLAIEQALAEI